MPASSQTQPSGADGTQCTWRCWNVQETDEWGTSLSRALPEEETSGDLGDCGAQCGTHCWGIQSWARVRWNCDCDCTCSSGHNGNVVACSVWRWGPSRRAWVWRKPKELSVGLKRREEWEKGGNKVFYANSRSYSKASFQVRQFRIACLVYLEFLTDRFKLMCAKAFFQNNG